MKNWPNRDSILISELENLDATIAALDQVIAQRKGVWSAKSDELYYELVVRHFRRYHEAKANGKTLAYVISSHGFGGRVLQNAMDIGVWERDLGVPRTQDFDQRRMDGAIDAGLPTYACSYGGKWTWGGVAGGLQLPPDLLVNQNFVCNTSSVAFEFWAHWIGVPFYRVERPHLYSEEAIGFYAEDLANLVRWLEEQTGHTMNWDRLAQNVEYLRQSEELKRQIMELRKAVPHPMPSQYLLRLMHIQIIYEGEPEAVEFFRQVLAEMQERVAQKKGYLEQERLRLLCVLVPPTHALGILDWWEQAWGAVSVMEPWVNMCPRHVALDSKKPLESLARYHYYGHLATVDGLPIEEIVDSFVSCAKDYSADGVVWYASRTCQHGSAIIQMAKDALKKRADVPLLAVDVDLVDATYVSEAEMREQTEPFFEMLLDRKGIAAPPSDRYRPAGGPRVEIAPAIRPL